MLRSEKSTGLILLLLSALCWGPAYLFIKLAIVDIPPITLAFLRVAIASIIVYFVCLIQKQRLSHWKHLFFRFAIMGLTLNAIPFSLISWSERYISSSLAGLLVSLALIVTVVLAHFFGKHERLTPKKIIGLCFGIIGLCFIYLPMIAQETTESLWGVLLVILASCSIGSGTVYARIHLHNVPAITALAFQLIIATIILLPLALLIDLPMGLSMPSAGSLLSMLALTVISTVLAYYFYYKSIQLSGATYASLALILIPIFAMTFGGIFLKEHFSWNFYLGAFFILTGVGAVSPMLNRKT